MRKKNVRTKAMILCAAAAVSMLGGCGSNSASNTKPEIHLSTYIKTEFETTTVKSGDIAPILELSLMPDEYETKNYKMEQSDLEIESVNVSEGDKVNAGDIMVQFKADEIQETIDEYTEQLEEAELLIEHYEKLAKIDGGDYSDEITELQNDIKVAKIYIEEQTEKKNKYCIIAERGGTVTYVNEWLQYGYTAASEKLVTVVSGSSNYTATTDDDFEFTIGDIYEAEFDVAIYEMKVIEVSKYEDEATGKQMQTILFEPVSDMTGVSEEDTLDMTIEKPVIKDVTYVEAEAIYEKDEGEYYVYTVNDEGYRTAVDVVTGDTVDGYTIIESGVSAGEQVTIN